MSLHKEIRFGKETTDQDQLVYVNGVIFGKLLEYSGLWEKLRESDTAA